MKSQQCVAFAHRLVVFHEDLHDVAVAGSEDAALPDRKETPGGVDAIFTGDERQPHQRRCQDRRDRERLQRRAALQPGQRIADGSEQRQCRHAFVCQSVGERHRDVVGQQFDPLRHSGRRLR